MTNKIKGLNTEGAKKFVKKLKKHIKKHIKVIKRND